MKKLLVSASALVALAVTATPAYAVPATEDATATVRVLRPLQLTSTQNLDLQTVVLSGAGAFTATVGVAQDGTADCDAASGNVTCSGVMQPALYEVRGAANQVVDITVDATLTLSNLTTPAAPALTLTVDAPADVDLGADGNTGFIFAIGGSITVTEATVDGVYQGTFDVTADYQ
ncbi:MAG: DUF4402 domain-containing protein [Sphingomonas sp.]|jgi:hypothetical protein|nr:DUF4402 domain-containing protein [Sphingomonas sp.]